jgi:alcohol dehydrogenase class IV
MENNIAARGGAAFTPASVGYVHVIAHNPGGLYGVPRGLANPSYPVPKIMDREQCEGLIRLLLP